MAEPRRFHRLGWQPPQSSREPHSSSLLRDNSREGEIALCVAASDRADVERPAKEAGFLIEEWNNGMPWHEDYDEGGASR